MPAILAGVVSTVIAYAGPAVIVFQAGAFLPADLVASWVWAISIGSGVLCVGLSLRYRVPVIVAWSIPGSVLLLVALPAVDFAVAVGAYLVAALAILGIGLSGMFDRIVSRLPAAITAAMLAGLLFGFAAELFVGMAGQPLLVLAMCLAFFVGRRWFPRYAVLAVLVVGVGVALAAGQIAGPVPALQPTMPTWTTPRFEWHAIVDIALPLVVVALTGQFVPGLALIRNSGYAEPPARPLIAWSGLASALLAPLGCHGLTPAAVTAALCMGTEASEDPRRRYVAGVVAGLVYALFGFFAATVIGLFAMLPAELVATLAGLALFPAIANAMTTALSWPDDRDAALVTFIVSASGMSLLGLGAPFWGLVFGLAVHALLQRRRARIAAPAAQASK
ncbi:benzoate/H(+) symporter BenE family transporter [Luteimonas sp. S4-F44]|uniref:benzoate/H(+) symporter BenE family transporter n=1 Tax=Luteimonas sp. S4-F44 TaxID=2925842 RepID=UPI001F535EB2|nr:benzoate/H(+) symporter BenE family transporter [Luteimonas sp. S4-F44]UNK42400.1 benzoate/H(+) symporter BenE family transporter [Luteimonas sp. S4-F44]